MANSKKCNKSAKPGRIEWEVESKDDERSSQKSLQPKTSPENTR